MPLHPPSWPLAHDISVAARLRRYRDYLDFYNGRHWPTPTHPRRTRLVLNYARAIVDKGVSYLLGRGINFAVTSPDPAAQTLARQAEQLLYRVYDDNDLAAVDLHAAINAAVLGDAVFKVFWDPLDHRLRVTNVDPFRFRAHWAPDDLSRLVQAELHYSLTPDELTQTLAPLGLTPPSGLPTPPAATHTLIERWTARALTLLLDGQPLRATPNPLGFIPFVHVPNLPPPNEPWGVSDLRDLIGLNRELNASMSDRADIIRFHADPPVVFRGVTEHSDLPVGPGTVWDLPPDAEVKLLEWRGQPETVQQHLEWLFRALYEVSETPRTAFGDSGRLLSGVALEVELRPLIQKTLRKRVFWDAALRRRSRMLLRMAQPHGLLDATSAQVAALTPRVIWPPMVPRDDGAEVRNNIALVGARLRSHRTAMDALGEPDPEAELRRIVADTQELGQ